MIFSKTQKEDKLSFIEKMRFVWFYLPTCIRVIIIVGNVFTLSYLTPVRMIIPVSAYNIITFVLGMMLLLYAWYILIWFFIHEEPPMQLKIKTVTILILTTLFFLGGFFFLT